MSILIGKIYGKLKVVDSAEPLEVPPTAERPTVIYSPKCVVECDCGEKEILLERYLIQKDKTACRFCTPKERKAPREY